MTVSIGEPDGQTPTLPSPAGGGGVGRGQAQHAWAGFAYAVTLAQRELRGGIAGFRVFLACLVLGVAAIAAIGSLEAAVDAGIAGDARGLLGGDISARLALRSATNAEHRFLAASGAVSEVIKLRAMARTQNGDKT